jgi:ABC-type bacteriocin/lantibiotic exporter with double-glycine peptidase domain
MADSAPVRDLEQRFPQLRRLGRALRPRRIPLVQQLTATECGAACLAMVLGYHGRTVRLDELRNVMGIGRDGSTALAILNAANWYGLRGRGVRLDTAELQYLQPGSILHWEFNHFVVFERYSSEAVDVVDPGMGRRRIPLEQFRRSFTGVALLLEPSETFAPGSAGRRPIWTELRKLLSQSGDWYRIVTVSLMLQLFALALPVLTGMVIDRVVPRGDAHLLLVILIGLGGIVVFNFLASMIRAHLLIHLRTLFDSRMTLGFLDHLLQLPYAFFQRRPSGDLMMRLNSTATIREMLSSSVISALIDGGFVSLYLIILFAASGAFGFLVLGLALVQVAILWFSSAQQRDLMAESLNTQARSESYLVEMLAGIETLKASGTELRAGEHWSGLFVDQLNVALERARLNGLVESLNGTLRIASQLVILGFGALQVLGGTMTLGTVLALAALANGFLGPLSSLAGTATQLQLLGRYLERIEDVLITTPEQNRDRMRSVPKLHGRIALDHVSFRYDPGAPMVVRDVSVDIAPGQFVAIVGRSGSGKSTLAKLLLGLYAPSEGRISYDGMDLSELDIRSVRRQLGIVNQSAYLFGASIGANIAIADPELPRAEVVAAAKLAHIHDEITAMPMGYDTLLLNAGASLSGGQQQRVAIARALAHRPAIVLLDEATSALDAVTERAVQADLARLACTRIVIAHRLSTIRDADLILVMHDGQLIERGTHTQLLAAAGEYARLVAAQIDES